MGRCAVCWSSSSALRALPTRTSTPSRRMPRRSTRRVRNELFTVRAPFEAKDPLELIAKHITLHPPAPSAFVPMLPPAVDTLVGAMLDKHPPNRPALAHIRDVLEELRTTPDADAASVQPRKPATTVVSTLA